MSVWETSVVTITGEKPTGQRAERIAFLEEYRPVLIKYLQAKVNAEDWHGCADASMDLRDLDCELDGLRY